MPPGEHGRHRLDDALEHLGHHAAAQPFTGLGDPTGGRHRPRGIPAPPPIRRPSDLRRDLFVVVLPEQAQRHRQIRRHVRRQLPTAAPRHDTTRRDRSIDCIPRHRCDQHTQRHLIQLNFPDPILHARDRATTRSEDQPATPPDQTPKPSSHNPTRITLRGIDAQTGSAVAPIHQDRAP
jgi:hypothetical protein